MLTSGIIFLLVSPALSMGYGRLMDVLSEEVQRGKFAQFVDNVLRQIPSDKLFPVIDEVQKSLHPDSAEEQYKYLVAAVDYVSPTFLFYRQLQALHYQQQVIADQVEQLLSQKQRLCGYVEIGTAGTYINDIKKYVPIEQNVYLVGDHKQLSDYVQNFSLQPLNNFHSYDLFVHLDNYAALKESDIASNSVDLVTLFVGLHHIPEDQLSNFIASIYRVLRPGGTFILREHDVQNAQLLNLTCAAHTLYNAMVARVSFDDERSEYRNFRNLEYWIQLLEFHGFKVGVERLLQAGDPTLNTMLKFTKIPNTILEIQQAITHDVAQDPDYKRNFSQTYLTTPEWVSVDMSQEYAQFIETTPFYEFPYFSCIKSYWDVFKKSWLEAVKRDGLLSSTFSSYTLMNLFIGSTMTVEYAAKGLISLPIQLMFAGVESGSIEAIIDDPENMIESLDTRIRVVQTYQDTTLKLIEMPRYKSFLEVVTKFSNCSIQLWEIAGNKKIACKVRKSNVVENEVFSTIDGCSYTFEWQLPTQKNHTYVVLTLEVSKIRSIFKRLREIGVEILYLHDF